MRQSGFEAELLKSLRHYVDHRGYFAPQEPDLHARRRPCHRIFSDRAEAVRRLYLRDEQFRSICEDLLLAQTSLLRFESRPDAETRVKIKDFRNVLQELKAELRTYLRARCV
jgi:hypothetical protein